MIISAIYIILAVLLLSFLIFIHEFGHYWMAKRVGMKVETFSIGYGRPIYVWYRNGVKWQIGWLFFGGYVKIAGAQSDDDVDPYEIKDGFFGKSPWARLKVAFMGPFVNIVFAFIFFSALWAVGGRSKNFSEFTHKIGALDPSSELYAEGVRPGDEITAYDDYPFQSYKDHTYAAMVAANQLFVQGLKIDYLTAKEIPFQHNVKPYSNPLIKDKNILTAGVLTPASYIIYSKLPSGAENPLLEGSPLMHSGIQYGDRLLWVDGKLVFSMAQLSDILNDDRVLLTVKRGNETFLRRVPRIQVQDVRPNAEFKEELMDWLHEAGIDNKKSQKLYIIPYNLTFDGVIENVLRFVDDADKKNAFPQNPFSKEEESLLPGDKIVAAQGTPISRSFELLGNIQNKHVSIIIQKDANQSALRSWKDEDKSFYKDINMTELAQLTKNVDAKRPVTLGNLTLLPLVTPKNVQEFAMNDDARAWLETERQEKRRSIAAVEDPEKRRHLLKLLEANENLAVLGLPAPQDRQVIYNPAPSELFSMVFQEIWRTTEALFTGSLSPKYVSGPIGIVQMVHHTSMISFKEALFWLGAISLNLGMLNLLPLPILDGGTILLSLFEMVTGRRISQKLLERVIFVFAIVLVSFFLFLTYNDLIRVFGNLF